MATAIGLFISSGALPGCSDPVGEAKQRYEFVKANGGTKREICSRSRDLQEAYLKQNDSAGYKDAQMFADVDCLSADLADGR